eukprot:1611063-Amphidinium_carterae.2
MPWHEATLYAKHLALNGCNNLRWLSSGVFSKCRESAQLLSELLNHIEVKGFSNPGNFYTESSH